MIPICSYCHGGGWKRICTVSRGTAAYLVKQRRIMPCLSAEKEHDHALSLWVKAREIARLHKNHNSVKRRRSFSQMSRACSSGPWALCWCAPMRNFSIVAQMDQLFEIDARARQEALTPEDRLCITVGEIQTARVEERTANHETKIAERAINRDQKTA
jgi:hypothetical protein